MLQSKKGPLPNLGKIVWEAPKNSPYRAYIFQHPAGHQVGYVRIPTFMVEDSTEAQQFEKIIQWFQKQTDGLVIDQINNPGGLDMYMYGLISMLTNRPLELPTERITLTQEDVYIATMFLEDEDGLDDEDLEDELFGYNIDSKFLTGLKGHFQFVINEWNAGRTFTNPTHMYGLRYVQPHPRAHYSKPILVLVNGLAFSCGDFFPAILQDNKRATIFGSQTAGAGGFVLQDSHFNHFGVAYYTITGSLAQRLNKQPIENLGVTPDIPYQLTERDLAENYPDYVKAVYEALKEILPAETTVSSNPKPNPSRPRR